MKIIHISDTHICPRHKKDNSAKLNHLLRSLWAETFDHVVITGDLTDNADDQSLRLVRDILNHHGLLRSDLTTVVPGNHDIFGTMQKTQDILGFHRRSRAIDYKGMLDRFVGELGALFQGAEFPSDGRFFPFVKTVRGLALIGMNSNKRYSLAGNPLASKGSIAIEDFHCVQSLLERSRANHYPKIVLSHHGLQKRGLAVFGDRRGRVRIEKEHLRALQGIGAGLVLHGHTHEMKDVRREGIVFANAGASIDNNSNDRIMLNEVQYDGRQGCFRVLARRVFACQPWSETLTGDRLQTVYEGG